MENNFVVFGLIAPLSTKKCFASLFGTSISFNPKRSLY